MVHWFRENSRSKVSKGWNFSTIAYELCNTSHTGYINSLGFFIYEANNSTNYIGLLWAVNYIY